jgi:hypothetical protein
MLYVIWVIIYQIVNEHEDYLSYPTIKAYVCATFVEFKNE